MKTDYPICSEMLEPTFSAIMSRLWKQVEEVKETHPHYVEDACFNLWKAVKAMNTLAWACSQRDPRPVHCNIAIGNEQGKVAEYIKDTCGFNPWHDTDHPTVKRWNGI
jgi:hypothetical protein